ncbi:MAG: Flp family type IVb pilin [Xanthobacteraceae bacterium]
MFKRSTQAIRTALRRFASDECGATAIEYALIASGVSVAIVGIVGGVGSNVKTMFNSVSTALK